VNTQASCYCEIRQKKNVSRCAVMGKEGYGHREGRCTSVAPKSNGIDGGNLLVFNEKFIRLERSFAKEKKGEERGGPGLFIAGCCFAEGARVARGERRSTVEVRRAQLGYWPEVEGDLPGGPGMSAW
jgi:hypothetical protein